MPKKLYSEGILGRTAIYDAGDDLPLTNPLAHLGRLYFHSDLDYIRIAYTWTGVINHPGRVASGTPDKYNADARRPVQGVQDYTLFTHNLGFIPAGIVVIGNDMLPGMASVQSAGPASNRFVSLTLSTTTAVLRENWFTFNNDLPAIGLTYKVYLFSQPIVPAGIQSLRVQPDRFIASRGKLDSAFRYIKSAVVATPDFFLARGPSADVSGGGLRIVTPAAVVKDDGVYNGSFSGTPAKGVKV